MRKLTARFNITEFGRKIKAGEIVPQTDDKGDQFIWVDVVPNKNGEDKYGNTHAMTNYNAEKKKATYIMNFKTKEVGETKEKFTPPANTTPQVPPQKGHYQEDPNDLPF